MAPVNQLGVLAFASAVLAVPHAQWQPFKRHAHPGAPPAYESSYVPTYSAGPASSAGASSMSAPAYGSSASSAAPVSPSSSMSAPAYGSSSSSAAAVSGSSSMSAPAYGSSSSSYVASSSASPVSSSAIPSQSAFPSCWSSCFQSNGITAESQVCGNDAVSKCIHDTCSSSDDKAYWSWYESYCKSSSSSAAAVSSSASSHGAWSMPSGGYGSPSSSSAAWGTAMPTGYSSGAASYSTCTETSTLIYKSTTEYSTYYVTHTLYESSAAPSVGPASSGPAGGYSAPAYGSAPAGSAPAGGYSAPASSPAGAAGGSCVPDVTVTETQKTTVYVTAGASSEAAPSYPAGSSAAPSYPAGSSAAPSYPASTPAASSWAAPSYPAGSSSASAAAPSYSAPATGGQTGKRGLCYNDANLANAFSGGAASGWAYNWLSDSDGLDSNIPYIPMLWGPTDDFTGTWDENAKKGIANGAQYLFSFNEPDMSTQSNLSPEAAAQAWMTYMEPYAGQAKLVAPSVTNSQDDGMGLNWLQSFLDACSECTIDAYAQHWYFPTNDADNFKDQVTRASQLGGGKGVFVNEFGAIGSDSEKSDFLKEVMPWMDSNDSVLGYSYFMVSDGLLMTGDGPSSLGQAYSS